MNKPRSSDTNLLIFRLGNLRVYKCSAAGTAWCTSGRLQSRPDSDASSNLTTHPAEGSIIKLQPAKQANQVNQEEKKPENCNQKLFSLRQLNE